MTITMLRHNKIDLALHRLREGDGTPLSLLHGLGESSPTAAPEWTAQWAGPVTALDFTGHGGSTVPPGGGYTAEIVLADADHWQELNLALAETQNGIVTPAGVQGYIGSSWGLVAPFASGPYTT